MEIVQLKVMRGPNYWSVDQHKLIVMKIRHTPEEQNYIPTLVSKLGAVDPSFQSFGNISTIRELVARTALALQSLAGMENTLFEIPDQNNYLIYSYTIEKAGMHAARVAVTLINSILAGEEYDIQTELENLHRIRKRETCLD